MLSTLPSPQRLSNGTRFAKAQTPYVDTQSVVLPHGHPGGGPPTYERLDTWRGQPGYGQRHVHDNAPFSLWDDQKREFRSPTRDEIHWITEKFQATRMNIIFPDLIVETASPPRPVPLTIAGVAVTFVAPPAQGSAGPYTHTQLPPPIFDPRPIRPTTGYAGPRIADPLNFTLPRWAYPSKDQMEAVMNSVMSCCTARAISFLCPWVIIEIRVDGRTYHPRSLPGKFAGFTAIYHHQHASVFHGLEKSSRDRLISPSGDVWDRTNYLRAWQHLCPGVMLESSAFTRAGRRAAVSLATSAGVLVRDNRGNERMTVANHGFLESDDVFHPTNDGQQIGEIDERWPLQDIALVRLHPAIKFTNAEYFECRTPRRLLKYSEVVEGSWSCVDGMSTGAVWLYKAGVQLLLAPRPSQPRQVQYDYAAFYIDRTFGATGASVKEGICGAPIVDDDVNVGGGVAGFFQLSNGDYALSPVLDEFIDRSWSLV